MNVGELRDACRELAEKKFRKAEKKFGRTFMRPKRIEFSNRMTSLGGCASFQENIMSINLSMLEAYQMNFANQIVPHEVAHLVCVQIHGTIKSKINHVVHGPEWREVMLKLGEKPERCHTFRAVKTRKYRHFKHVSECGQHTLLLRRTASDKSMWDCFYRTNGGNKIYLFRLHGYGSNIPNLQRIACEAFRVKSFITSLFTMTPTKYGTEYNAIVKFEQVEAHDVDFV